jgi:alcohol dehydrogenase, propanol-preferring
MLAVRLQSAGGSLRLEEVPVPEPAGAEVRVRVAGCGVCRTDLHIVEGTQARVELPVTLGHEVAGWIDAIGPDATRPLRKARLRIGDPVVVFGGWGCGDCTECRSGEEQRCPRGRSPGFQVDGGYAEYLLVPDSRHLVALGPLDPVDAAPLADAGLTPFRAVRRASPWLRPGARVLVVGLGALGQFGLQYLRGSSAGSQIEIAVRELEPSRLELAAALGADLGLLGDEPLPWRADAVFDFVGSDDTLRGAGRDLAPNGLLLVIGEAGGRLEVGIERVPTESWVSTIAWGAVDELGEVVRRARRRQTHWTVERMPLAEAAEAHRRLRAGEVAGRIVLVPD